MNLRLTFTALGLLACIFPVHNSLGQIPNIPKTLRHGRAGYTSAHTNRFDLFEYRSPTIRNRDATARSYIDFAIHFMTIKRRNEATDLALDSFQSIRRSGDILAENIFVNKMTDLVPLDTTLIPLLLSMTDRLVSDNDSLVPRLTDKEEQRGAINQLAETALIYVYALRPDLVIRYEPAAIGLNERLHQHATFPYQDLSFLYTIQGRLKEALALALDGMRVAETPAGPIDGAGYEAAARAYFMTGDIDKCEEYTKKALTLFFRDPTTIEFAGALIFRYTQILLQQQKSAEALRLLRSIDTDFYFSREDVGDIAFLALSWAECFRVTGQNDSAERYYAIAFANSPATPSSRSYFRILPEVSLAAFYTETRRYIEAARILESLLADNLRNLIPTVYLEKALLLRYQVDSALRNYPRAMVALRQYQQLHDSLTNYRVHKQLVNLSAQSETEKTAQHIVDLEKQNALQTRLQEATIRQNRMVRNSLIAGAALLALFAAILYRRYRTRRRMTVRLQKLLKDKEWLLREIHHRVKNNLQIIVSLLNLQRGQLCDKTAINAIEEIGARVNAISLVHKKLYQETDNMTAIDMRQYIHDLVCFLDESFVSRQHITFQLNIDPLTLDVTHCVPLGLILNEAVTNAIKYAFPATAPAITNQAVAFPPTVTISLKQKQDNLILVIADNGVGLPPAFDQSTTSSLGLQLIQTLTLQLEGNLEMINQAATDYSDPAACRGLSLSIRFPREATPDPFLLEII